VRSSIHASLQVPSLIPLFSNSLGAEELQAVADVFSSRWVGKGRHCADFEKEFAAVLNAPRVLLTNSCTSAIFIAVSALGIRPGDEVIVSTINFVACAGAVAGVGATPVFADVDPHTLNITPSEIERLKTPRTKAVFLLHYAGHPCDMDGIKAVCADDIAIIEDCANAIVSSHKGEMCGTIGAAGVFSFDAMKILVMGDGGALVIKDDDAFERAESYRYLGLSASSTSGLAGLSENRQTRWWEYELDAVSGRFISNDILAAIGRVQLKKLHQFIARRREIWDKYQSEFEKVPELRRPPEPLPGTTSSYYLYWVQLSGRRDALAAYLAENDVYSTFRYYPLHLVKHFGTQTRLPAAELANETTLNLPLHQNLTDDDVQKIVGLVVQFLRGSA